MKVGDMVKLIDDPNVRSSHPCADFNAVGIITEFTCHERDDPHGSGWVQWGDKPDWNIEYGEDLEVISAHR